MSFLAQFNGVCDSCGGGIVPTQEVEYVYNRLNHVVCPQDLDKILLAKPPCPKCFMVPAANGECGCDG